MSILAPTARNPICMPMSKVLCFDSGNGLLECFEDFGSSLILLVFSVMRWGFVDVLILAPRVAGLLVKIFVWILESWIFGPIVVYILKKDNLIHKVFESFLLLIPYDSLGVVCFGRSLLSLHFLQDKHQVLKKLACFFFF